MENGILKARLGKDGSAGKLGNPGKLIDGKLQVGKMLILRKPF